LKRGRKNGAGSSREARAAAHFGVTETALSEIEETIEEYLKSRAHDIASRWAPLPRSEFKSDRVTQPMQTYEFALELAEALHPALYESACKYTELLTDTIVKHRGRTGIHWTVIANRAIGFCSQFARWAESRRWFSMAFLRTGLDKRSITPIAREGFLTRLSAWIIPPFQSTDPRDLKSIAGILERKIRHIARLAPPRKNEVRRERQDVTRAMIARVKHDNPGVSIESICKCLDLKRVPLPHRFKGTSSGSAGWHETWKSIIYRPRIKSFISGIKPALAQRKRQVSR
jgi:hypothetical protein